MCISFNEACVLYAVQYIFNILLWQIRFLRKQLVFALQVTYSLIHCGHIHNTTAPKPVQCVYTYVSTDELE